MRLSRKISKYTTHCWYVDKMAPECPDLVFFHLNTRVFDWFKCTGVWVCFSALQFSGSEKARGSLMVEVILRVHCSGALILRVELQLLLK